LRDQVPSAFHAFSDAEHPSPGQVDLASIVGAITGRWKLIIAFTILTLVWTYGVLQLMPRIYESSSQILIFDPESQMDEKVQTPISPFRSIADSVAMNTETEVLKSKTVALRVAEELHLDKDPEFQPHSRLSVWAQRLGFAQFHWFDIPPLAGSDLGKLRAKRLDGAAEMLRQKLKVEQIPFSYILSISMTSQDPAKAQHLTETVANDFLAIQRDERLDALQRVASWLKGRVDDLQPRILETEAAIEKLKTESGLNDTMSQNLREQQITELNSQLMKARGDVADYRAHLDQARVAENNGDLADIPEIRGSIVINRLRQQQGELNAQEARFGRLGENHAPVVALDIQLAEINKQLSEEAEHVLGNLKVSYDIAMQREASLEASLQKLTAPLGESPTALKLRGLERVADTDRKLHENYLTQYNEASQRLTLAVTSARIITPATLPERPSSPRTVMFYALGVMIGLAGGVGLAFLLEYVQRGLKTRSQVEQTFGYPLIGTIPIVQNRKFRRLRGHGPTRAVIDEPLGQLSESVRAMRIGLEISNSQQAPKVILVTSSLPGEGKSTAATLLGVSSAMSGRKTVLIDCDLRRRSISATLSEKKPGLSELLGGAANLAEATNKHPLMDMDVIAAGSVVRNPGDLLMSESMRDLIGQLRERYDYIVMDASPLLAVVDALALATVADKILVVAEWSRTWPDSISEAFKVLRPEQHRVAGIVLNKVDLQKMRGYGYVGGSGSSYRSLKKYFSGAEV
jgi:polysaccharide biosynthesis transport protein